MTVLLWVIASVLVWLVWRFVASLVKKPSEASPTPGDEAEVGSPLRPKPHRRSSAALVEPEPDPEDVDAVAITN